MTRPRMTFLSEMDAIVKVLDLISLISKGEAEMEGGWKRSSS